MVKYQPPNRTATKARAIATIPLIIRDQGIEVFGVGYWVLGVGYWGLGTGGWGLVFSFAPPTLHSHLLFLVPSPYSPIPSLVSHH
ncbi:MAG TPA: hypothetical protein DEF48_08270 [Nostoc sp. UBA8866]|nr:hypothetical protein [Nostoc sp. UBA8866]